MLGLGPPYFLLSRLQVPLKANMDTSISQHSAHKCSGTNNMLKQGKMQVKISGLYERDKYHIYHRSQEKVRFN